MISVAGRLWVFALGTGQNIPTEQSICLQSFQFPIRLDYESATSVVLSQFSSLFFVEWPFMPVVSDFLEIGNHHAAIRSEVPPVPTRQVYLQE